MVEIEIFGSIVSEKTQPNQVTMTEIRQQLIDADGEEVTFLINSGGGSVINGTAILDEMDRYPSTINSHIMGICGSMATAIASKSQFVSMNANALYMIHNPQGGAVGEVKDLERAMKNLNFYTDHFVSMYMAKTGLEESAVRSMMDKATYMNAEEALELGFINEITDAIEMTAEMEDFILGMDDSMPEQAKAYFKQEQTETNMSEETKEKGTNAKLDAILAFIGLGDKKVEEPVAEVEIDFEAKFNELDVEMKAKDEDHKAEIEKLKELHVSALTQAEETHKAELEDVVAKVEVVAKAFEDGKLSVIEAKEELKSEAKAEDIEEKLEDVEDKFSAEVAKDEIEDKVESEYSVYMGIEDTAKRQAYYKEHQSKIDEQYQQSHK